MDKSSRRRYHLAITPPAGPVCVYAFRDNRTTPAELEAQGFKLKAPWTEWSEEEKETLRQGLLELARGDLQAHTQDKCDP
jgi:hypothetical protein